MTFFREGELNRHSEGTDMNLTPRLCDLNDETEHYRVHYFGSLFASCTARAGFTLLPVFGRISYADGYQSRPAPRWSMWSSSVAASVE